MEVWKQRTIAAGEFKAKCLQLMDEVKNTGVELVITKRGQPVAKLVPAEPPKQSAIGWMNGTVTILGDIVNSDPTDWPENDEDWW
jgi:prevent-host-death family protein